jgi:hypothetical protein
MTEEIKQWEYRVQTIGSVFGTKDEYIQAVLNEWGEEGWEAVNVYTPYGSGKIIIVSNRPLTDRMRRIRSMPQPGKDKWNCDRQRLRGKCPMICLIFSSQADRFICETFHF